MRSAARSRTERTAAQSDTNAVVAPSAQPRRSDKASVSIAWRCPPSTLSVSADPGVEGKGPTAAVRRTR